MLKRMPKTSSLMQRINNRSKWNGECLEWTGYTNLGGYGKLSVHGKLESAHRVAWKSVYGAIPKGKWICHHCDNRKCVNVVHLFLGTRKDNIADMVKKKRRRGVGGQHGEKHHQSLLNDDSVRNILSCDDRITTLARKYKVSVNTIWLVRNRITWKHIKLEV